MQNISGVCLRGLSSLQQEFSQINIYDVYVDFCLRGQQQSAQRLAEATGYDPRLLGPWAAAMGVPCCTLRCVHGCASLRGHHIREIRLQPRQSWAAAMRVLLCIRLPCHGSAVAVVSNSVCM